MEETLASKILLHMGNDETQRVNDHIETLAKLYPQRSGKQEALAKVVAHTLALSKNGNCTVYNLNRRQNEAFVARVKYHLEDLRDIKGYAFAIESVSESTILVKTQFGTLNRLLTAYA